MPNKVLIIAPHADDAEFALGGYIARMIRQDIYEPVVRVVAGGDYINRTGHMVSGETRLNETAAAMRVLGVKDFRTHGLIPENEFDLAGRAKLAGIIDSWVTGYEYEEVFFPFPSFNQDHTALHEAVLTAFRPNRHPQVAKLWCYEYPGNTVHSLPAWGRCLLQLSHADMALKLKALACHKTQNLVSNDLISTTGAERLARWRGAEAGCEFAELVCLLREVF